MLSSSIFILKNLAEQGVALPPTSFLMVFSQLEQTQREYDSAGLAAWKLHRKISTDSFSGDYAEALRDLPINVAKVLERLEKMELENKDLQFKLEQLNTRYGHLTRSRDENYERACQLERELRELKASEVRPIETANLVSPARPVRKAKKRKR